MSLELFQNVLTGSLGALAFLCLAVWALIRGIVHPDVAYQSQVTRVKLLEAENTRLNGSIVDLTDSNTKLQIELATMRTELMHVRGQVERLMQGGGGRGHAT
jgi:hypothetical protein